MTGGGGATSAATGGSLATGTIGGAVAPGGSVQPAGGSTTAGDTGGAAGGRTSGGSTEASGSMAAGGTAATGGVSGGTTAAGGATGGTSAVGGAAGGTAAGSGGRSVGGTAVDAGMAGGTTTSGGRTGGATTSGGNSGGSKPMGGAVSTGGAAGRTTVSGGTTASGDGGLGTTTSDFHCVNWADTGDNFQNGVLQPSGLVAASDTYATVKAKSDAILSGFQTLLNANTIRIPINEPTVVTNAAWWTAYKGIIDSAISKNMKVIIGYWAIKGGTLADPNSFYTMWQTVIDAYLSSDLVYFEIMNEPYALQPAAFIDFAAQWLARYPTVPHNRVVVAGDYTDTDVNKQGADPRLAGCLLSLHFYNFSTTTSTAQGWSDYLKQKVGPYYNRTIVTEYGVVMTTGINYPAPSGVATPTPAGLRRVFTPVADPTINTLYMVGTTNQMREWKMGSCLWVGLRNNDTTSITKLSGTGTNLSLTVTNPSALTLIQWGWGL